MRNLDRHAFKHGDMMHSAIAAKNYLSTFGFEHLVKVNYQSVEYHDEAVAYALGLASVGDVIGTDKEWNIVVGFEDAKDAMLFKLAYGGEQ